MNQKFEEVFSSLFPNGKPFKYQLDWAKDESKYKIGVKARQIGITWTEAVKKFLECLLWKESAKSPYPHVIIFASPSQRQSSRLMEYMQRARAKFEKTYQTEVRFKKEREDHLLFDNRCEIWSLPNNPKTIEGIDASHGIIDEAANFSGKEDEEVYQALLGSLGAKGGGITLFGRPRGRRGLYWKLFDPYGEYSKNFSTHVFKWAVRAAEDPVYKNTVEEQKLRLPPLSFAEQYECEFVDENILIYPWELLDRQKRAYRLLNLEEEVSKADPLYMGVDFARKTNETVVSVVRHTPAETKLIFQETSKKSYDSQIPWISKAIDHFSPLKCWVDKTGLGIPLLDFLESKYSSRVEGVQFTSSTKEKLLMTLKNLLESGNLIIPDHKELLDQLHGMEKIVTDQGTVKYTGKRTETDWLDDRAWSLALACYQLGDGDFTMTFANHKEKARPSVLEAWMKDLDHEGNPL